MPVKVSVVVPVYNAGDLLERCAPSLLEQSMRADEYEVVYVDDGSSDDSLDRLVRLAERYPHARWLTQPNSGWPGKPRNVGIAEARGDYIQFVDQDDQLGHEALERLYAAAVRDRADIVIGKIGGSMAVPNPLFRRSVSGSLAEVPAIESLTGHKMFRKAYLDQHRIRFPEGYWRMEDLLFVARAYAHDPRLSVVADYTCYWWHARADGGNNSVRPFAVPDHYARLREIIATLRDATEPGPLQDQLLGRLYRIETLSRVTERYIFDPARTDWEEAFPYLAAVARECFPPSVRASLPAVTRLRGALVEAGEQQAAYELAGRLAKITPVIRRDRVAVGDDAVLRADLTFTLALPDRRPLALPAGPDGVPVLDRYLTDGLPGVADFPVADPLNGASAELQLEDVERGVWWYPAGGLQPMLVALDDGRSEPGLSGELAIDPAGAADGGPLPPGRYTVWFSGQLLGVSRRRRLVMPKPARAAIPEWTISANGPVVVRPDWTGEGARLHLEVRDRQEWLASQVTPTAPRPGARPGLPVHVPGRLPTVGVPTEVEVGPLTLPARIDHDPSGTPLLVLTDPPTLPPGSHEVRLKGATTVIGLVTPTGLIPAVAPPPAPAAAQPRGLLIRALSRLRG